MMDIKEDREKYKLMYDHANLLTLLGDELNESVVFRSVEFLIKE